MVNEIEIQAKPKYYCYFRENKLFWNKNITLYLAGTVSLKFAYDQKVEKHWFSAQNFIEFQCCEVIMWMPIMYVKRDKQESFDPLMSCKPSLLGLKALYNALGVAKQLLMVKSHRFMNNCPRTC